MGSLVGRIADLQDRKLYAELNWTGSFEDYPQIIRDTPEVTRASWRRLYDMIVSHGVSEDTDTNKKVTHYTFYDDPFTQGRDAVFGLDVTLMKLVNVIKSAAYGYGS